ncbi:MAG: protoporphyrinogen oxidase [Acidobacteriales bacterium]|nr:protoporphyrinogen oxidase [Terriglobales bacterium]
MSRVVIVGGGISGISTAYYLSRRGIPATLVEKQDRLGGVIHTETVHGCVIESGPDSFIAIKPWALDLINELGLSGEVIGSNDHLRVTYLLRHGRLLPLPDGLMLMVPTKLGPMISTRLLGWPTKIHMGLEMLRKPPRTPMPDRSVADFIRDHYGQETVDYLAEPLLAGVYGGDPEALSVRSVLTRFVELEAKYGSLSRGVLAEMRRAHGATGKAALFRTLKRGLGAMVEAAVAATGDAMARVRGSAETIEPADSGYRVRVDGEWLEAGQVVLAAQAYQAAELVEGLDGELARDLAAVPYSSSTVVSLGYRKAGFPHPLNGFGFLVPKRERGRMMACTWVGTKFAHRAADDYVLLRCFLGGDASTHDSDEIIVAAVRHEIHRIMGVGVEPVFVRVARWPRSMAQYTVGHQDRVKRIEERMARLPGLHLAGNGYHGIGVPDCIRMGRDAAARIARGA